MGDSHKSRKFLDLQIGDLFTFRGVLYTKTSHNGPYNAISDTTTGSQRKYFKPNTVVEKLDE